MEKSHQNPRKFDSANLISIPGVVTDTGELHFWENETLFPNGICRCFWITAVTQGAFRGEHAHWEEGQVLVSLAGSVLVEVEGINREIQHFQLKSPSQGLFIPPMNWVKVSFSPDAVLLGLSDRAFAEEDYIRDLDVFRSLQLRFHEHF
ncbi:MAG: hypothetical protein B7Z16_05465 [Algoriphagus sp. 32-45-6]|jgi:hypothetical protein|nr:MAG: hypothetical protein B7Z16_05465 [Algoriphagus sp. 32-45-6]